MVDVDHELECLLGLDGHEFQFGAGFYVKLEAQSVGATAGRPAGIKYSLTLHDPGGHRIYGMDNAHGIRKHHAYDHRHVYGEPARSCPTATEVLPLCWRTSTARLSGFYKSGVSDERTQNGKL